MRQLLAAVFAAAVVVGVGLGAMSLLDRTEQDAPADDSAVRAAAEAWATAATAGDLEELVLLATEQTDPDTLAGVTSQLWDALGGPPTTTVVDVGSDGGTATATLQRSAALGPAGVWDWQVTLPLQRSRGDWAVVWTPEVEHPQLREGWSIRVGGSGPVRAPVLDRIGRTLSSATAQVEIGIQPSRLPSDERVLSTVAGVLPEAVVPLQELLERDDLEADWFYRLVTVDLERADEVFPELLGVPGILRRPVATDASTAAFAPEVIGATVEGDDGTLVGVRGLQLVLNDRLDGSAVVLVELLDGDGGVRATLASLQEDPSPPLVTTLDRDVQRALQDVLLGEEDPLAVAVVDVVTGGLLATASRPDSGYARGLEGRYPPGLLAGTVTLTAALAAGTGPETQLDCPDRGVAGGVTLQAGDMPGAVTGQVRLGDALAADCTVGLARLAVDAGGEALSSAEDLLGLTVEPDLVVASTGWRWPAADSSEAALASAAAGHGAATTSVVSAAALAGSVARGAPITPHLLADGAPAAGPALTAGIAAPLADAWLAAGASGRVTVPGLRLAGMSARTGLVRGDPAPATGWWVGWISEGGPEVAMAVMVEGDDGTRAAELARRVLLGLTG